MGKFFTRLFVLFIAFLSTENLYAQEDVTRFLGLPVDGFKSEMIEKLKSKGFTSDPKIKGGLNGEFNGSEVNVILQTNNNKVWRIAVADVNPTDETNIKIKFNNLVQQFQKNKNYVTEPDTTIAKYTIPEKENISYELTVHKKRYQAVFYQKSAEYDLLNNEKESLLSKDSLTDQERERLTNLIIEVYKESLKSLDKIVWFTISEEYGKYYLLLFYENIFNKAKGEGL